MKRKNPSFGPNDIYELLIEKLSRRGILLVQVPLFIKDVMDILAENSSLPVRGINSRMVRLGWGVQVLDSYVLELIRYLAENPRVTSLPTPDLAGVIPNRAG